MLGDGQAPLMSSPPKNILCQVGLNFSLWGLFCENGGKDGGEAGRDPGCGSCAVG